MARQIFDIPPLGDMTEAELDAFAGELADAIAAGMEQSRAEAVDDARDGAKVLDRLVERAYVRDRRGRFSATGGRGTGGPLLDSSERNTVGGDGKTYTGGAAAVHDQIIADAQAGIPTHPGQQVAVMTGGGAGSGKSSSLMPELERQGLLVHKGDRVDSNADIIMEKLPDYQKNHGAGNTRRGMPTRRRRSSRSGCMPTHCRPATTPCTTPSATAARRA